MVVILMGVAGVGKSTVGALLARQLGWRFVDGDDFHPLANLAKMAAGVPLSDEDRAPWLQRLRARVQQALEHHEPLVLACSALRLGYRQFLTVDPTQVRWVYLKAPPALLRQRLAARSGHFLPTCLLDSQLATLEEPQDVLTVDVTPGPEAVAVAVRTALGL